MTNNQALDRTAKRSLLMAAILVPPVNFTVVAIARYRNKPADFARDQQQPAGRGHSAQD